MRLVVGDDARDAALAGLGVAVRADDPGVEADAAGVDAEQPLDRELEVGRLHLAADGRREHHAGAHVEGVRLAAVGDRRASRWRCRARSVAPAPPAAFLKVSRPLFVASRISQPSLVYERPGSRWSGLSGMPARRIPPFTGAPVSPAAAGAGAAAAARGQERRRGGERQESGDTSHRSPPVGPTEPSASAAATAGIASAAASRVRSMSASVCAAGHQPEALLRRLDQHAAVAQLSVEGEERAAGDDRVCLPVVVRWLRARTTAGTGRRRRSSRPRSRPPRRRRPGRRPAARRGR